MEEKEDDNEVTKNDKTDRKGTFTLFWNYLRSYEVHNVVSAIVALISVFILILLAINECNVCFSKLSEYENEVVQLPYKKTFWIYGKNVGKQSLEHVFALLDRFGYIQDSNESNWDLLWSHDYPFNHLYAQLKNLKKHQKVNHFPGMCAITCKVVLSTSGIKYTLPAFRLPSHKNELLQYAKENPDTTFVCKNNEHRQIKIQKLGDINLGNGTIFVQKFVDKPLLVSGHKFDIGIYTVITSIEPLRVYIYNGDALLRFCLTKYYPFDPNNLDKYVVGDDYLPIWQVPALEYYYNELGFGMRDSLNAYLTSLGRNPNKIWEQIEDSIRVTFLSRSSSIIEEMERHKWKRNFFELVRFDFIVDEDLNVFLLEVNMSPNLSSAHFKPNKLLYEQVLYNVFSLVGIGERIVKDTLAYRSSNEETMMVSDKNIAVFPKECSSTLCKNSCAPPKCQLCKPCLAADTKDYLKEAYKEHLHEGDCKRIFPPTLIQTNNEADLEEYSPENQLQYRWFQGKCNLDKSWC